MYSPALFEHGADGGLSVARSASRRRERAVGSGAGGDEGFHMSNGATTHGPVFPEHVWEGVVRGHQAAIGSQIGQSPARSARRQAAQAASPRSVVSL
jgi:hypothetical protein